MQNRQQNIKQQPKEREEIYFFYKNNNDYVRHFVL